MIIGFHHAQITVPQVRELLVRHGIEIIECVPIPGIKRFEFRDPFGNRVECTQLIE